MQRDSQGTPTSRRSFLGTIGLTLAGLGAASGTGAATGESYALEQGDRCVPVTPLSGDAPVEELYDWNTDDSEFSAAGLTDLQRPDTSLLFLYDGPNGLSLVLVHDEYGDGTNGGSATFEITGLPEGEWVVRDDFYDAESNVDRWVTGNGTATIDWTWDASRTDGGVYRGLADNPDLEVEITPAFNDAAALDGEHYDGEITAWEVLTGSLDGPDRASLALDESVVLRRGTCSTDDTGDGSDDQTDDGEDDQTDDAQSEDSKSDEEQTDSEEQNDETADEAEKAEEEKREKDEEDGEDDHPGKGKGRDGDHPGKGKGHEKGNGKGHENGKGKGHGKHGNDDDEEDEDD